MFAPERIVLFQFDTVDGRRGSGRARRQLKPKDCANQHLDSGKLAHLVSTEFRRETRSAALLGWETVSSA